MQFILIGFSQVQDFRVFTFERVAADHTRTQFRVRSDLALTRRYGIHLQDLPLLCRGVLERCGENEGGRAFTLSEEEMVQHQTRILEHTEQNNRKNRPRPPAANDPTGWRNPSR